MKVKVRQYIPNPMRCKNCQLLGHTAKHCTRSQACVKCNLPPHAPSDCSRISCANCFGEHSASSLDCPKFKQSKDILRIKTFDKCSMREAVKKYKQSNPLPVQPLSYAAIASKETFPNSTLPSINIRTEKTEQKQESLKKN